MEARSGALICKYGLQYASMPFQSGTNHRPIGLSTFGMPSSALLHWLTERLRYPQP